MNIQVLEGSRKAPFLPIFKVGVDMVTITEKDFKQFAEYIKTNYGINLKEEKLTLVLEETIYF